MFIKSLTVAALSAGFVAGSAHAQRMPEAANPERAGTQVSTDTPIRSYKNAQAMSQEAATWVDANVAATSQGGHDMHGMQHGAPAGQASADPHAGHAMSGAARNSATPMDHSGHAGQAALPSQQKPGPTSDPHAGHAMPAPAGSGNQSAGNEDHSMHDMQGHAGHQMAPAVKAAPKTARPKPAGQTGAVRKDVKVAPKSTATSPAPAKRPSAGEDHSMHDMSGQTSRNMAPAATPAPKAAPKTPPAAAVNPAPAKPRPTPPAKPAAGKAPTEIDHGGHQ